MRLTESIHWIGCGGVGPWFTHQGDCNVYLLRGPRGCVMVDVGGGEEPELIERQLRWDGVRIEEIKALLLTHPHVDHTAGAPYWRKRCGAQVFAPAKAAAYLRRGCEYAASKPGTSSLPPCPVDVELSDEQVFEACGLSFRAIAAPGHCDSMLCYLTALDGRKVLATGDCFYWGGKVTVFQMPDADRKIFRETLIKLRDVPFDAFLPGHRYPVLGGGKEHLELAIAEIDRQLAGQPAMRG